jgi:hypothetical protein
MNPESCNMTAEEYHQRDVDEKNRWRDAYLRMCRENTEMQNRINRLESMAYSMISV